MASERDRELAQLLADGDMDDSERAKLEPRIAADAELAQLKTDYEAIDRMSHESFAFDAGTADSEAAMQRLRAKLRRSRDPRESIRSRRILPIALSGGVGLAAGLLLGVLVQRNFSPAGVPYTLPAAGVWSVTRDGQTRDTPPHGLLETAEEERRQALRLATDKKFPDALIHAERSLHALEGWAPPNDPRIVEAASLVVQINLALENTAEAARLLEAASRAIEPERK